ncbi:MAG TPA: thioredoxin family protein [Chloroflexota bacterium]|nr:thioredoxin family protein [Chloroflexota bacterium]
MNVKILGTGCSNCKRLEALVREVAAAQHLQPEIDKVTDIPAIMAYGIMHTPGLVIDGEMKASGRVPSKAEVASWLQAAAAK